MRSFPDAICGHLLMRASQSGRRLIATHDGGDAMDGFITVASFTILAALWLAFAVGP
jgi:hypothetical protein